MEGYSDLEYVLERPFSYAKISYGIFASNIKKPHGKLKHGTLYVASQRCMRSLSTKTKHNF